MSGPKAVILGLDGATLRLIRPWVADGLLPNLKGLMDVGRTGVLHSTIPATTPLAWPSIFTGCEPGKHGIFGFYRRKPGTYEWAKQSGLDLRRPAIWDILGAQGLRSGVFFVPYTFPARPLNGVMVTGRGGASDLRLRMSHPPDLAADLVQRFGELAVLGKRRSVENVLHEVARDLEAAVNGKTEVIAHMVERESLDLVFAVWDHTDTVAHLFWHHTDLPLPDTSSPVFRIYKAVDDGIGRVLDAAGGDPLVFVCSDHGTYPVHHRVRIVPWLQEQGALRVTGSAQAKVLSAAAATSQKIPEGFRSLLPVRKLRGLKRRFQPTVEAAIDWSSTKIYPQPATAESLYVNMVGREPGGTVEAAEAAGVLDDLTGSLLEATTPAGEPIVRSVHRGSETYRGSEAGHGPDLIVESHLGFMFAPSRIGEKEIFWQPPRPVIERDPPRSICYHDPEGMLIVKGPGVRPGASIDAHCTDLAPTLLAMLGLSAPPGMDGHPIQVAGPALDQPPTMDIDVPGPLGDEALSAQEEQLIERQLRDLGYVE